jgi:hypothetical protein
MPAHQTQDLNISIRLNLMVALCKMIKAQGACAAIVDRYVTFRKMGDEVIQAGDTMMRGFSDCELKNTDPHFKACEVLKVCAACYFVSCHSHLQRFILTHLAAVLFLQ